MKKINVLIVGAGPAGCSSAYFLKNFDKDRKFDIKLIERLNDKKYNLYHEMCGGAIGANAINEFKPLKLKGILEKINLIREFYPHDIEIRTKTRGYIISRPIFLKSIIDNFILLGGTFENKTLKDISIKQKKIKVKFSQGSEDFDYVIAADGSLSILRNKIGLRGYQRSLIQYIVDKEIEKNTIKFYYDEKYGGDYRWEFPYKNSAKIGYPMIKINNIKPKEKILIKQSRVVAFGGLSRYIYGNILLVGDSACQANPLTKGGIRSSIIAGKLAARAIIKGNARLYEKFWFRTKFSSKIFMQTYEKLKNMNNDELAYHIKPFIDYEKQGFLYKFSNYFKTMSSYNKYIKMYRCYNLINKFGW